MATIAITSTFSPARRDPWRPATIQTMPGCAGSGIRKTSACRLCHKIQAMGDRAMDITILGRIGYDLYSEEPHVPLPQVRRFSRYLGGSSANMAVGLARLGANVAIIGALGADSLSQFLLEFLRSERVDVSHVKSAPGF